VEESAFLISILAGTFYLIASLRLIRLSGRTHERPELLLGLYFSLSGAYYIAYNLPSLFGFSAWLPAVDWAIEAIYVLGVIPYMFFIRAVFRPEDTWAGVSVGLCSAVLLGSTVLGGLDGRALYSFDNPWFLPQWAGYTLPCAWICVEATLAHRGARKRARIGLCAPAVANRYLLLALFGGFQVLACVADLSYATDVSSDQTASLISEVLLGGAEIASVAVLWLAFFPPPFYTDWITRRAVVLPTPMEG
jgi:hypothetical protein